MLKSFQRCPSSPRSKHETKHNSNHTHALFDQIVQKNHSGHKVANTVTQNRMPFLGNGASSM